MLLPCILAPASDHRRRRSRLRVFAMLLGYADCNDAELERWCLILSRALRAFLEGRVLKPPPNLRPA